MQLVLINLYSSDTIARYLYSSYVLKAYLDSHAGLEGRLKVRVLNFGIRTPLETICSKVEALSPDCIGYSCYIWNIEEIISIVAALRERTRACHILGGPEISTGRAAELSERAVGDYYVVGEGEQKLASLMTALMQRRSEKGPVSLPGVGSRDENGFHYRVDHAELDLSRIPSVYLTGALENELYEKQQAFLETQRGCRFKCTYCVYHKDLPRIKYYPLPRILEELEHLIVEKQVSALRIIDALFTSDLGRAKDIARFLARIKSEKGIRLPWIYWEFVYNSVDEEFCAIVSSLRAKDRIENCRHAPPKDRSQIYSDILKDYTVVNCVGVQSFTPAALRSVNRPAVHAEHFSDFMQMLRRYNIVLKADMILGLPFETFDSYFRGLEHFLSYFPGTDHILNIHRLQILPGTQLEQRCGEYEIDYSRAAPHTVHSTNTMTRGEMDRASRLTAVLFRAVNSPLRQAFLGARERTGVSLVRLCEDLWKIAVREYPGTRLAREERIDDDYWNNELYRDLPSAWLADHLGRYEG